MASQLPEEVLRTLLTTYGMSSRCATRSAVASWSPRRVPATSSSSSSSSSPAIAVRRLLSTGSAATPPSFRRSRKSSEQRNSSHGQTQRRTYAQLQRNPQHPRDVAVIGGGLTGLTTAWYLARFCPATRITLYEASPRLGGWLETSLVPVQTEDGRRGKVAFERAARMIKTQNRSTRWDDLVLYEMITNLKLRRLLRATTKHDKLRRFIYYPDHLVDVSGPDFSSLDMAWASLRDIYHGLTTEPLYTDAVRSALSFAMTRMDGGLRMLQFHKNADVSVGAYFTHAFGGRRALVDNMLSALVHGIYGGDVWSLSMRSSLFGGLMTADSMGRFKPAAGDALVREEDWELMYSVAAWGDADGAVRAMARQGQGAEYLSLRGGLATLTEAMERDLRANPMVTIRAGERVEEMRYHSTNTVQLTTSREKKPADFEKVISTLLARQTASLARGKLPSLEQSQAVSIQLVNLWYPNQNLDKGAQGFGYLVPTSTPATHNPSSVLGVIFDSDREAIFDANARASGVTDPAALSDASSLGGTKLTVMMGGHLWKHLTPDQWPDENMAIALARRAVAQHLNIPETEPAVGSARLCRDCLPQHAVGHYGTMACAHAELEAAFRGRVAVAGGSYQAPGILTSVRAARDVAAQTGAGFKVWSGAGEWRMRNHMANNDFRWSVGDTGLARFARHQAATSVVDGWVVKPRAMLPFRYDARAYFEEDEKGRVTGNIVQG